MSRVIRTNPMLVVYGNPGARRIRDLKDREQAAAGLMSHHVMAVIYRHIEDGELYVHGFGDANIEPDTLPNGALIVRGLKENTGVDMYAQKDGSVLLVRPGVSLWGKFDV